MYFNRDLHLSQAVAQFLYMKGQFLLHSPFTDSSGQIIYELLHSVSISIHFRISEKKTADIKCNTIGSIFRHIYFNFFISLF